MKLRNLLIALISPLIIVLPQLTSIASAQVRSDCNAPIVGRERGTRVNIRANAGTNHGIVGYVLVGQLVNMMNNSEGERLSRKDNQGSEWYFVEYLPSQTRGWVREDFIGQSCVR